MNQSLCFETQNTRNYAGTTHLQDYLMVLKRRFWIIMVLFLTFVGLALLLTFLTPTVYEAKVQILIEKHKNQFRDLTDAAAIENRDRDFFQTQYNLLRSRALALAVIDRLNLWAAFGYQPHQGEEARSLAVDRYLGRLTIAPIQGSQLVVIRYLSPTPELAAMIADAHAREFIDQHLNAQHAEAKKTLDWLKNQLNEQEERVKLSQQKIHDYNRSQDIVSMESSRSMIQQNLLELNTALTEIRSKRIAKEQLYRQLDAYAGEQENLFSIPEIAEDPIIQNLRKDLIDFKTRRLEMATKFGPKHPKMLQLNSSIQQLSTEIGKEVQRICQSIKADLDRIQAIEATFANSLEQKKMETLVIGEKMIKYDLLQHEAESNRQLYDILLKQAKEMSLTGAMESNSIRIIDAAEKPLAPVRPKPALNLLVGVMLGLFFGIGAAFFMEYMDNTISTPEQVERHLGLPVLGVVPYDKHTQTGAALLDYDPGNTDKSIVVYQANETPDFSARLANLLQLPFQDKTGQVLVVESAVRGEGKTTVVANMAVNFAKAGLRVAMLDCDARNPSLHAAFDLDQTNGLLESIERVLYHKVGKGSLKEFSVDDLFFTAMLRRFSGLLYVSNSPHSSFHELMIELKSQHGYYNLTNDSQVMRVCFSKGHAVQIDNQSSPFSARLGRVLLKGGFITKNQLVDALERTKRTGLPFGYILINTGYVSKENLQGPMKLQMEENLHTLFSWKQGSFSFQKTKTWFQHSDRVYFDADFSSLIKQLGELTGSVFYRDNILSCLQTVRQPNLFLINPGMLSSRRQGPMNPVVLSKYIQILRQYFDVVLMDTPPLLESVESAAMAAMADAVILVVQAGKVAIKNIQTAKSYLDESNCKTVWTILNQAKRSTG